MLSADQAADRLGIKVPSLYAYVSRGLVERHTVADGRSMFDAASIAALASRGRPRVSSKQTLAEPADRDAASRASTRSAISYRGHDVTQLCGQRTFEEVAEMLWLGSFETPATAVVAAPVASAEPATPRWCRCVERLRIGVGLRRAPPIRSARTSIRRASPLPGATPWPRWSPRSPTRPRRRHG